MSYIVASSILPQSWGENGIFSLAEQGGMWYIGGTALLIVRALCLKGVNMYAITVTHYLRDPGREVTYEKVIQPVYLVYEMIYAVASIKCGRIQVWRGEVCLMSFDLNTCAHERRPHALRRV